jgi:nitronate monooxygenase
MAGGPTCPALVTAIGRAAGLAFLAAGYETPDALRAQIDEVRASGVPFGVNLFAPSPVPVDAAQFREYADRIAAEGEPYGIDVSALAPIEDDDAWSGKLEVLRADPVPVVSFTFGFPDRAVLAQLQKLGTAVGLTVTSVEEARAATDLAPDLLFVQSSAAGGHSGTLTPQHPPVALELPELLRAVAAVSDLPLIGAGGIGTATDVTAALRAGAAAVAVGTALLRSDESAATATHKQALADAARTTVVTRAFTGRPARGLANGFIARHSAAAPLGYPALHHLTRPIRRAAAAAGDAERVNLWAGTGYRHAASGPAAAVVTRLCERA